MPRTLEKKTQKVRHASGKAPKAAPQPIDETVAVVAEGPVCAHHWVIATPNGETSTGRCKVCGTEKEFPNSADDYLWERSVPQSRWTGRADASPAPSSFNNGF